MLTSLLGLPSLAGLFPLPVPCPLDFLTPGPQQPFDLRTGRNSPASGLSAENSILKRTILIPPPTTPLECPPRPFISPLPPNPSPSEPSERALASSPFSRFPVSPEFSLVSGPLWSPPYAPSVFATPSQPFPPFFVAWSNSPCPPGPWKGFCLFRKFSFRISFFPKGLKVHSPPPNFPLLVPSRKLAPSPLI